MSEEKSYYHIPFKGVRPTPMEEVGTIYLSKEPFIRRKGEGVEFGDRWEIYPVTITSARYGGTYEGGYPWLAFPVGPDDMSREFWHGWQSGDVHCAEWWARAEREGWPIGRGDSPCEAYDNLVARVKAMAGVEMTAEEVAALPEAERAEWFYAYREQVMKESEDNNG